MLAPRVQLSESNSRTSRSPKQAVQDHHHGRLKLVPCRQVHVLEWTLSKYRGGFSPICCISGLQLVTTNLFEA